MHKILILILILFLALSLFFVGFVRSFVYRHHHQWYVCSFCVFLLFFPFFSTSNGLKSNCLCIVRVFICISQMSVIDTFVYVCVACQCKRIIFIYASAAWLDMWNIRVKIVFSFMRFEHRAVSTESCQPNQTKKRNGEWKDLCMAQIEISELPTYVIQKCISVIGWA